MEKVSMWPRCITMFWSCYCLLCMCCNDSACFFRQCIADINFGLNMRFRSVRVADLRGGQRQCLTPVSEGFKPERRCTHHWAFTIFLLRYLALVCTNAFRLLNPVSNPVVYHLCESIWAEIYHYYSGYHDYDYYDNGDNSHNSHYFSQLS